MIRINLFTKQRASLVAQMVKNQPAMQETQVQSLGQEDPLEKIKDYPVKYSCLENSTDRGISMQNCISGLP